MRCTLGPESEESEDDGVDGVDDLARTGREISHRWRTVLLLSTLTNALACFLRLWILSLLMQIKRNHCSCIGSRARIPKLKLL